MVSSAYIPPRSVTQLNKHANQLIPHAEIRLPESKPTCLLTTTILEAKVNTDTSSFIQDMKVYCRIGLLADGNSMKEKLRKTGVQDGQNPKFTESFGFRYDGT